MLSSGAGVDMLSGRPLDDGYRSRGHSVGREEQERQRAEFAGVLASEPGRQLRQMIETKLLIHVERVMQDDPEARVLLELLQHLGQKEAMAHKAMQAMVERRLGPNRE